MTHLLSWNGRPGLEPSLEHANREQNVCVVRPDAGPCDRDATLERPAPRVGSRRMKWTRVVGLGSGVALLARAAVGAPPDSVRMVGEEAACPSPAQVVTVLRRLLPRMKVTAEPGSAGTEDATIVDEGSQYRVTIAGQERSFIDAARQCAERARHAAVFVALVLDPPTIPEPSEPAPPAPPAPVAATPVPPDAERPALRSPAPQPAPLVDLTLGPTFQVAPAEGD